MRATEYRQHDGGGEQSMDGVSIMQVQNDERLLLSAREAARQLGISERTLWGLTEPRGTLPVVRIGSRCLYSRDALVQWIGSQRNGGAA
jgi:excisionase family DNA binding protein